MARQQILDPIKRQYVKNLFMPEDSPIKPRTKKFTSYYKSKSKISHTNLKYLKCYYSDLHMLDPASSFTDVHLRRRKKKKEEQEIHFA